MIPSKKEKQLRRQHLKQLQSELARHQMPDAWPDTPDRPQNEAERQALVERRIQQAMANGDFDHLPGKGKPLALNSNPYLEPGQELAFGLLKNNGFAPDWIERDKEIRRELEGANFYA
jgi:DnaJ family protein C protein 28